METFENASLPLNIPDALHSDRRLNVATKERLLISFAGHVLRIELILRGFMDLKRRPRM